MNILYLFQIILIDIWVLFNLKSGMVNKLISAKFNDIIVVTGFLLLICSLVIFYLIIKGRIKIIFKFDPGFFIVAFLIIALFSDKKVKSSNIIINKYKGSVNFNMADYIKKNTGIEKNYNSKEMPQSLQTGTAGDTLSYQRKDLIQVYNELTKLKNPEDIENYSYNIETIGQIYLSTNNNIELYEKEFMLVRFFMVCCVADMTPIAIVVENKANIDFTDDEQWLQIRGRISFVKNKNNSGYYGFLEDENIEKIPEPEILYLNPISYLNESQ